MNNPDANLPQDRSVCATCGAACADRFCGKCGQRQSIGRHTLRGLAAAAARRSVGEEGAFHTMKLLSTRPGQVIRDYVAGRTVRYVHPAAYLLLTVAVFAVVARALGGATGAGESDRLFTLLIIPFVAAASRLLFWRDGYNYAEHLIAAIYLAAHAVLILVVFLVIGFVLPQGMVGAVGALAVLSSMVYFTWGYSQVFAAHARSAAARAIVALLLGAVLWAGFTFVVVSMLRR